MAKDPAFLFYPGDYIAGTMHLDFEAKGAYVELLMLQFNKDRMTIHMIKHMLGHKFDHIWSLISDKFQESDGYYWNERLRVEKEKRVKFCKSRKENKNKGKTQDYHMILHMENENENNNTIGEKLKIRKAGRPERGVNFDEMMENVVFSDNSTQPLGSDQKELLKAGQLNPRDIIQGLKPY
jgi:uncharacterized protein YdaU (DUF1376 family)